MGVDRVASVEAPRHTPPPHSRSEQLRHRHHRQSGGIRVVARFDRVLASGMGGTLDGVEKEIPIPDQPAITTTEKRLIWRVRLVLGIRTYL